METVEDVQCVGAFLADDFQIGLPHVRADEDDLRGDFFAYSSEESLKGLDRSLLPDPEQTGDAEVDLIDQRQVLVAFGVLDLIDSDGVDLTERAVRQSKRNNMFHRVENLVPGGAERLGRFFPRKPARPTGQKQHVSIGQLMLAIAPGNFFDDHGLAAAAIDAPHGVQQKDQKTPERDEFVAPFGELIVAGRRLMATGTDRRRTATRTHGDFDAFVIGRETGMLVNEAPSFERRMLQNADVFTRVWKWRHSPYPPP